MRPEDVVIDENEMTFIVNPDSKHYPLMSISITGNKVISANGTLQKKLLELSPERKFIFKSDNEGKIILLRKNDNEQKMFTFNKGWRVRHEEFADNLQLLGYELPIKYVVAWNEQMQAYVGTIQNIPDLGNINDLIKKVDKKCRTVGRKK